MDGWVDIYLWIDEWMDIWLGGSIDVMDGYMDVWIYGWMVRYIGGCMYVLMNRWMDVDAY